jgi:hypothetical protein
MRKPYFNPGDMIRKGKKGPAKEVALIEEVRVDKNNFYDYLLFFPDKPEVTGKWVYEHALVPTWRKVA